MGEDAISSYNLLTIDASLPTAVVVEDTRVNESTKGADFEFWIGHSSTGWFRYAIQAKRLSVSSGRYNSLKHDVGGTLQIDILEKYAYSNRAAPVYCFYNFWHSIPSWKCCSKFVDGKQYGCTVTPSSVVRHALSKRGGKSFDGIHRDKRTLPWRCLVKCPALTIGSPSSKSGLSARQNSLGDPNINNFYETLPQEINALRQTRTINDEISNGYGDELQLRPRWIGIIELEGETLIQLFL